MSNQDRYPASPRRALDPKERRVNAVVTNSNEWIACVAPDAIGKLVIEPNEEMEEFDSQRNWLRAPR